MNFDNSDNLTMQRIAGGSIIEYPPLFSHDSEILFIVWNNIVRAYSTVTGEWVRDFEGAKAPIVSVHLNPLNSKLLFACTETGEIFAWKWKSGVVNHSVNLKFDTKSVIVNNFFMVNLNNHVYGFIAWIADNGSVKQIGIFDVISGLKQDIDLSVPLHSGDIKVDVSKSKLCFLAIIQNAKLHVLNYENGCHKSWRNAYSKKITCVACHPHEEMIATGDESGKILLWRNLFQNCEPMTRLYHWHHTPVNTIAFSESGSNFYSGGDEGVLVQWHPKISAGREFLPRLSVLVHIVVATGNQKIAICGNDNGIQIINTQFKPIAAIQNFTWVPNDKTITDKFPIGLAVNPRNACLVLNGRQGHLQFYSTHTRSLLYNLDTTIQNTLSIESNKFLYNTSVTHTALNMDWMATIEKLDDFQYSTEIRLKFWKFDIEKQMYTLNTHVELPHEIDVTAIKFSSSFSVDNLLCATSGKDNFVKIWSLSDGKNGVWECIGKLNYKNLSIISLDFSSDGSLLAVGYGNNLCVYCTETLQMKCTLNSPSAIDGIANKLLINLPNNTKLPNDYIERKKKIFQIVKMFLEKSDDKKFSNELAKSLYSSENKKNNETNKVKNLLLNEQENIFKCIMTLNELNFYNKLELFRKLNLHCKSNAEIEFKKYLFKHFSICFPLKRNLLRRSKSLSENKRYMARLKLNRIKSLTANEKWAFKISRFNDHFDPNITNSGLKTNEDSALLNEKIQCSAQICHVAFGSGDHSHLVIVCTENRLLIWNLLTLRLQTAIKLSVHKLILDPYTSLVAAFTKLNELYIFLPNTPMSLYHRKNLPDIYGAVWIPRRYPKSNSINLDWQAVSQLYFLNEKQELLQLVSDSDLESLASSSAFVSDTLQPLSSTPFGAMIAKQMQSGSITNKTKHQHSAGVVIGEAGKTSVREITSLQTHTIPPVTLLCNNFLKSLLQINRKKNVDFGKYEDDDDFQLTNHTESDDDVEIIDEKVNSKKVWLKTKEKKLQFENILENVNEDKNLMCMLENDFNFRMNIN